MTDEIDDILARAVDPYCSWIETESDYGLIKHGRARFRAKFKAAAIRTALRDRGYEIVTRDPTEAMLKAFGASDIRCGCEECATTAWAAMIAASPDRDEMK